MGKLKDIHLRHRIKTGRPVAESDGDGLTFTLSERGTAAWVLRYRFGGKARELTLGRYPDTSLAKAREEVREARAKIQKGVDVAREKQKTKIETAAAKSFLQLATDYMDKAFRRLKAMRASRRDASTTGWPSACTRSAASNWARNFWMSGSRWCSSGIRCRWSRSQQSSREKQNLSPPRFSLC